MYQEDYEQCTKEREYSGDSTQEGSGPYNYDACIAVKTEAIKGLEIVVKLRCLVKHNSYIDDLEKCVDSIKNARDPVIIEKQISIGNELLLDMLLHTDVQKVHCMGLRRWFCHMAEILPSLGTFDPVPPVPKQDLPPLLQERGTSEVHGGPSLHSHTEDDEHKIWTASSGSEHRSEDLDGEHRLHHHTGRRSSMAGLRLCRHQRQVLRQTLL